MGSKDTTGKPPQARPSGTVGHVPAGGNRQDTADAGAAAPAEPLGCRSLLLPGCMSNGFVVQKPVLRFVYSKQVTNAENRWGEKRNRLKE